MIGRLMTVIMLLSPLSLYADENQPLLFGPEFAFKVSPTETPGEELLILRDWMFRHLVLNQEDDAKFIQDTNTFTSPNGWEVTLTTDISVIEAKMKPLSRDEYAKYADDIQDALFVSAYNNGYFPQAFLGGGHISLSASYFANKPKLFRNFIVDLLNHSELGLGIWNYDTNNALSPSLISKEAWGRIREAIRSYDESTEPLNKRIVNLSTKINSILGNANDPYKKYWLRDHSTRGKHMAFYLGHFKDFENPEARIELRMFRPQPDMDTFVRQVTLIEKRIKYLESLGDDVKLEIKPNFLKPYPIHNPFYTITSSDALNPPIDPQLALREYYEYVTEAGEKWKDHQSYLWPDWIQNGELDKFNETLCDSLFGEAS